MGTGEDLLWMGAGLYVLGRGMDSMDRGSRRRATKKAVRKPVAKKKTTKRKTRR